MWSFSSITKQLSAAPNSASRLLHECSMQTTMIVMPPSIAVQKCRPWYHALVTHGMHPHMFAGHRKPSSIRQAGGFSNRPVCYRHCASIHPLHNLSFETTSTFHLTMPARNDNWHAHDQQCCGTEVVQQLYRPLQHSLLCLQHR